MMLLYNIIYDPYHTLLRMTVLCTQIKSEEIEYDRLRIYDFILAFPSHVVNSRLPRELTGVKNTFRKYETSYSKYNARNTFQNMESIQESVITYLETIDLIIKKEHENVYLINKQMISLGLKMIAESSKSINYEVIDFINNHLNIINLYGINGLKDRLGLMDFKYDAV